MKAGLAYPTWPDMNGEVVPKILFTEPWQWHGFLYFEAQDVIGKAIIQTAHRTLAYAVYFLILYFFMEHRFVSDDKGLRKGILLLAFTSSLQVVLGIITVLNCVGHIPLLYGVLHQAGAMLMLANFIFVHYHLHHSPAHT